MSAASFDQIFVTLTHWVVGFLPAFWQPIGAVILGAVGIIVVFPTLFALAVLMERKGLGRMQNRYGPNRVGPWGLLQPAADGIKVKVSFIIGADGRVHSPLILESVGAAGDRNVLQTVRAWRYRPATCNGVPTEAEGKIEFSRR